MKKTLITLALVMMGFATQMFAMSMSSIRSNARFLSDRMAYELDLTPMQYDDCYEINFDFIYAINRIMDDVVYGYHDAIDEYYRLLDYRNEDLRYVLSYSQYVKFITRDYFYRPVYSTGRTWAFRIHTIYSNKTFFYYDAPSIYKTYRGGHSYGTYNHNYYNTRHKVEIHKEAKPIKGTSQANEHGRNDFGAIRRDRNNKQQNSINNYSNPNQQNRTQDTRYRDNSGNKNSPQINTRTQSSNSAQSTGKVSGGRR